VVSVVQVSGLPSLGFRGAYFVLTRIWKRGGRRGPCRRFAFLAGRWFNSLAIGLFGCSIGEAALNALDNLAQGNTLG
jgi:hypothetical protein